VKNKNTLYPLLAVALLIIATLACGSDNTGTKVDPDDSSSSSAPKVEVYKVRDVIQVGDHTIVLNSAAIKGNKLQANFTVDNKGTEDLIISSILSFEAKDSDGTKLELEIFDCGSSNLDGEVLPGDKLRGDICWSGAKSSTVKIYYKADLFGSGAVVWEVKK